MAEVTLLQLRAVLGVSFANTSNFSMGAQSSFAGGVKQNFRALNAQHHPFSIPVYTPD